MGNTKSVNIKRLGSHWVVKVDDRAYKVPKDVIIAIIKVYNEARKRNRFIVKVWNKMLGMLGFHDNK